MVQHCWIIVVLVISLLLLPSAGMAQQREGIPRVGVLSPATPYHQQSPSICHIGFQQGLRDLGYVEGQNITFDYRFAEHQGDRLPALATEIVQLAPDVIWTYSDDAARAAKQATPTIPIVVGVAANLVEAGLAASLAHPGSNLTGVEFRNVEIMGKRLELLKEAIPMIAHVAVLVDPLPFYAHIPGNIEAEAHTLGVRLQRVEVRDPGAFEATFAALVQARTDALMIMESAFVGRNRDRLLELAVRHRLPAISGDRSFAEAGSLMAYGAQISKVCQRSAVHVDKILKGTKPAHIPVERADKFDLVLNLKTAQVLGITFPPTLLVLADEVIQ